MLTHCATDDSTSEKKLFLTVAENRVLDLFKTAQVIGEQLFDTPEVAQLDNPRAFLAQCMRRDILVKNES